MILRKGRITKDKLKNVAQFTSSIEKDYVLAEYDIKQSIVHTRALEKAGILTKTDSLKLVSGLEKLLKKVRQEPEFLKGNYEDIHMAIEEELGEIGKKLHAGRSRNDQIACDMRMYIRDSINRIIDGLTLTIKTLKDRDKEVEGKKVFIPAYTHLQRAQAVNLSTYLGVYINWFKRDKERLGELKKRVNQLPLGSAASASSNIKLDCNMIAQELGFSGIMANPMDAVSSRDYILEFANDLAILGVNLSRLAEDFIIFSSREFSFIELDESIADTSSIMPQKKNPDCLELIRSASGRMISTSVNLNVVMKGLPLTYNRDMQDDKEIFVSAQTAESIVNLLPDIFNNIKFNTIKMIDAAKEGFTDAADFAEYLVLKKNMDFRTAHQKTGKLVTKALKKGYSSLGELSFDDITKTVPEAGKDIFEFIEVKNAVKRRLHKK
ncbi:argininosuccinate lyase [Elusimicrobiota bacterium]